VYKYFVKKASKHCLTAITKEKIVNEWVNGNLSNFDYLMALNTFASRSFNDLSAYPVFPWIVAEYNEKEFAIHNPEFFRDLSKPIGALNKHRL
jgi:factor associated with neutral sphingomyelinase activation